MKRPLKIVISACLVGTVLLGGAFAAGVLAERSANKITVDGKAVTMEGYTIDGHNYYKLRDVAQAVGFGVNWNNATGTVEIETTAAPTATPASTSPAALSAFSGVDIDVGIADVTVQTGEGYSVSLESHGQDKYGVPYELHYTNEKGTLKVWSTPEKLSIERGPSPDGKVVITVPKGTALGKVKLDVGMGDLIWSDCGLTGSLDCELGMGDLKLSGSLSGDLSADLGMGSATISGTVSGDIELDLGMGDAVLTGDLTGDIDVNNGMGDVTLTLTRPAAGYSYRLNAAEYMGGTVRLNGKVQPESSCAGGTGSSRIDLSCGMGDVSLSFGG